MKRILKHDYQFYNLQEKFRKRKVSGFQRKIQYFEIRKCVRDGSSSPRKGLKKKKQPKAVLALQTSPVGEHKAEGKAQRVGLNNSVSEGLFSTFILGPKSLIISSVTKGSWGGGGGGKGCEAHYFCTLKASEKERLIRRR